MKICLVQKSFYVLKTIKMRIYLIVAIKWYFFEVGHF